MLKSGDSEKLIDELSSVDGHLSSLMEIVGRASEKKGREGCCGEEGCCRGCRLCY